MRALLTGITGQDGYYMARRLIDDDVDVVALVRDVPKAQTSCAELGARVEFVSFDFHVRDAIAEVIEAECPTFIFNFAAKSTGQGMFDAPREMDRLNAGFPLDILHAMLASRRRAEMHFVQASSSEMYGSNNCMPQNETSDFRPISPYGAAKLYAHYMVGIYRKVHGLHASSAILFNHESLRRGEAYVTRKIAVAAARIAAGRQAKLQLAGLSSRRDWGYAPEYVDAIYRMAKSDTADDYVVATGTMNGLTDVLEIAFGAVGLSYEDHIEIDQALARGIDSKGHCGDASKIAEALGWTARRTLRDIILEMVDAERKRLTASTDQPSEALSLAARNGHTTDQR